MDVEVMQKRGPLWRYKDMREVKVFAPTQQNG